MSSYQHNAPWQGREVEGGRQLAVTKTGSASQLSTRPQSTDEDSALVMKDRMLTGPELSVLRMGPGGSTPLSEPARAPISGLESLHSGHSALYRNHDSLEPSTPVHKSSAMETALEQQVSMHTEVVLHPSAASELLRASHHSTAAAPISNPVSTHPVSANPVSAPTPTVSGRPYSGPHVGRPVVREVTSGVSGVSSVVNGVNNGFANVIGGSAGVVNNSFANSGGVSSLVGGLANGASPARPLSPPPQTALPVYPHPVRVALPEPPSPAASFTLEGLGGVPTVLQTYPRPDGAHPSNTTVIPAVPCLACVEGERKAEALQRSINSKDVRLRILERENGALRARLYEGMGETQQLQQQPQQQQPAQISGVGVGESPYGTARRKAALTWQLGGVRTVQGGVQGGVGSGGVGVGVGLIALPVAASQPQPVAGGQVLPDPGTPVPQQGAQVRYQVPTTFHRTIPPLSPTGERLPPPTSPISCFLRDANVVSHP